MGEGLPNWTFDSIALKNSVSLIFGPLLIWGTRNSTLSNGVVEYAFDDGGGFIDHPDHLLALRHRSGSGT
jgi:hypothetical protein